MPAPEPAVQMPAPPAPAPAPPASTAPSPPVYFYPPGAPYPPGYGYPLGYPLYPSPAPPAASTTGLAQAQPVEARPVTEPVPEEPRALGWLRLDASFVVFPLGTLSYKFSRAGEAQAFLSGDASATPGLSISAEFQPVRYIFFGLSFQYLATVKWSDTSSPVDSGSSLYGSSGYQTDFLPTVGLTLPVGSWICLLVSAAPGYSRINASGMVKGYTDPGTVTGFVLQAGLGLLLSFSSHGYAALRATQQWGYQSSETAGPANGDVVTTELHSSYFGLHIGVGYWF